MGWTIWCGRGRCSMWGVSDTPAWIVSRANLLAELRGWTPFVGLQIQYSLIERSVERELTPMARELDLAITPWGALGSGILSGKYNKGKTQGRVAESERLTEKNLKIAEETMQVAEQIGCSASQVALAWVRQQPGVIIPILGARTTDQMWDNMGCLNVHLSPDQLERLNEASDFELGFPYDFLKQEMMNKLLYGGTF